MTKKKEKEVEVENTPIEEVLPTNQNGEEETIEPIVENDIETIKREDIETIGEKEVTEEEIKTIPFVDVEGTEEYEDETVEEVENNIANEDIDTISLDNAPISPLIQSEDEIIPKNFVNIPPQKPTTNENKIKIHNGRVYKDVGNGYGMYADNGETFRIK